MVEEATARIFVPAVDGSIGVQIGTQLLLMKVVCLVFRLGSGEGRSRWKSTALVVSWIPRRLAPFGGFARDVLHPGV